VLSSIGGRQLGRPSVPIPTAVGDLADALWRDMVRRITGKDQS
jgi:hypothetical protein